MANLQPFFDAEARLRLRPSLVTWSRLEPLPLTTGDLRPGLQALIGDPLWLVGRQWQFDELRGEDAGTPVQVQIHGEHAPLTRFHPGPAGDDAAGSAVDLGRAPTPIEVLVEAEQPAVLPERIRAAAGMQLLRLLDARRLPAALRQAVLSSYAFGPPPPPADPDSHPLEPTDPLGEARRRVLAGRVPDAAAVAEGLRPRRDADGSLRSLPPELAAAAAGGEDLASGALRDWLDWYEGYLAAPIGDSWDPHRQEYRFAAQAQLAGGRVVLQAGGYGSGTVDWHSFDAAGSPSLGEPAQPTPPVSFTETVLPSPVRYPGMPSDRLWAFEDGRVYLGGLDAGPTDLARLALVEFSLIFGNDWFLVPVDLPYGSVARVTRLVVRDTFGVEIELGPARQASRPGWTVFHLAGHEEGGPLADVFVLPATVRHPLQSRPLEEVGLFRDEMANMVWAVERVVQGPSGEPIDRARAAARVSLRQQLPGDLGDARIVYRLMTPVPEHWIPLVPVPIPGQPAGSDLTELERRPMVRFLDDGTVQLVHPTGDLLRTTPDANVTTDRLRVADDEVPREGAVVTRTYQLARMEDGGSVLWIGRAKRTGRGEGASGLKFDTALPPDGV
jgi:hypothetical protein